MLTAKTMNVMLGVLFLVGVQHTFRPQELKNRIEKSILGIKGLLHKIPDDKIAVLDGQLDADGYKQLVTTDDT